jgi:hypothetical protein
MSLYQKSLQRQHSFWGSLSPLGGLTGAGLLIMGSGRLSWAITISICLFWVYGFTTLTYAFLYSSIAKKIMPENGKKIIIICLASLWGSIYIFIFWLISPFAVLEVFVLLLLVPLFFIDSGIIEQISFSQDSNHDIFEYVSETVSQAGVLAVLLIAASIIREPFAYCSLSFPGSSHGMITIMYFRESSFFPIKIFSSSSGALILFGFFICLYQYLKKLIFPGDIK